MIEENKKPEDLCCSDELCDADTVESCDCQGICTCEEFLYNDEESECKDCCCDEDEDSAK